MAAATRQESQVLEILRGRWQHVSAERLLSGPGLASIYDALCILHSADRRGLTAEEITNAMARPDRAGEESSDLCTQAFNVFCEMLGTVTGNVALTLGATGGVYIAGGILLRVKEAFAASQFRTRFEQKGRLTEYMRRIPTYLILHHAPALLGLIHANQDDARHFR
jgi:glucokinase